jgi:hypothetical protein
MWYLGSCFVHDPRPFPFRTGRDEAGCGIGVLLYLHISIEMKIVRCLTITYPVQFEFTPKGYSKKSIVF